MTNPTEAVLIRLPTVEALTGLKKSAIYELVHAGAFPRQVKIGRASAWVKGEVLAWIAERIAEREHAQEAA